MALRTRVPSRWLVPTLLLAAGCPRPAQPDAPGTTATTTTAPATPTEAPHTAQTVQGAAPGAAMELHVGDTVQGRLENGDQVLADQSLGDDYTMMLTEGHAVTLVVRAGASTDTDGGVLNPQLVLFFNENEVASDDDSARDGASGNSRIVYSPPVSGLYVVRVTTSGEGAHHGAYALQSYPSALLRQR